MSTDNANPPENASTLIHVAHQHPGDLVLALLGGALPIPVTILAQDSFAIGGYHFTFNIIGESHLMSVARDGVTIFQELLACVPLLPDACRLYHSFSDLQAFRASDDKYSVSVNFVSLSASADVLTNYLRTLSSASLEVSFPPVYNYVPITRIWWRNAKDSVHWRTLHIYPDVEHITAVWSVSSFSVADYF